MSELFSERWKSAPLGSLTSKIGSGATPRGGKREYKSGGVPLIRSMNVHFDGFRANGLAYLDEDQAAGLNGVRVEAGDVLLNITGASIGRVTQAPPEMAGARVNQHVCIIRPVAGVEASFLARFLASPSMQAFIAEENYGVTRQALTKDMIEKITIPIPAIEEQRRIVAKLNSLFARSKNARDELVRIPRLVPRFKQAILSAAFQGTLTKDDASEWKSVTLGEVLATIEAGKNIKCEERPPRPRERGIVKISSVTWGEFDPNASKTALPSALLDSQTLIRSGDFLISRANTLELVGACVIVGSLSANNLYLSDKVLRLRFNVPIERWVLYFLRSGEGRRQIEELATGNQLSMRNISQSTLRTICFFLPPDEVRERILRVVEKALSSITCALADANRAAALLDRLDQANLAKAFRGELP